MLILTTRYWIVENEKIIFFVVLDLMVNLNVMLMVYLIILALWFRKIEYFSHDLFLIINKQDMIIVLKMDYLFHMGRQQQQLVLTLLKMIYFVQLLQLILLLVVIHLIFKNLYLLHFLHLHLVVYSVILQEKMDMEYFMQLLHIMEQNLVMYLIFVKKRKKKDFLMVLCICIWW